MNIKEILIKAHTIKVHSLIGYTLLFVFSLAMIAMNIFSFLVSLSIQYPDLKVETFFPHKEVLRVAQSRREQELVQEVSEFRTSLRTNDKAVLDNKIGLDYYYNLARTQNKQEKIASKEEKDSLPEDISLDSAEEIAQTGSSILESEIPKISEIEQENIDVLNDEQQGETISQEDKLGEVREIPPVEDISSHNQEVTDILSQQISQETENFLEKNGGEIFTFFENRFLKSDVFFLEDGIWYTYIYPNYQSFGKGVLPSPTDISAGGLNYKKTLLLFDTEKGVLFVNEYKKVKLISDALIADISGKRTFLRELTDDKKYLHSDTDESFRELKQTTQELTSGLTESKKIFKIYNYVTKTLRYTDNFSVADKSIFSGIASYETKIGACGGYSKLFLYMLSFAGIADVSVIEGYVLDGADFPNIGHAWVRIGNLYYDPTFDDPIGTTTSQNLKEYRYFALPKDIFYTNRFDKGDLPQYLRIATKEQRDDYIKEQLFKVSEKYQGRKYALLEESLFRRKYELSYNEEYSLEKLKEIFFYDDTEKSTGEEGEGYNLFQNSIALVLKQIRYDVDNYMLIGSDEDGYKLIKRSQ